MRPLELFILLAVLLSLLTYLVPRRKRQRWFFLLPLLVALLVLFHLLLEGYRWQMVLAYALAAIVIVAMAWGFRRRAAPQTAAPSRRRSIAKILAVSLGLLVLAGAAALPAILPVFSLPQPTGPYAVGTQYGFWVDEDRPAESTSNPAGVREVSVQIWYPAEPSPDHRTISYMRRDAARTLTRSQNLPGFFNDHFALVRTHAFLDADVAGTGAPFPVITYSTSGLMSSHMTLFEALASHGYVVVCIGHPYWNPFVYGSGGEVLPFDGQNEQYQSWWAEAHSEVVLQAMAQVSQARTTTAQERAESRLNQVMPLALNDLRRWAGDIGFVLDQLEALDEGRSFLNGALDLEHVGITGFSKGGAAAGQFCATDARCKAGINFTGFMYGDILDSPLHAPFFFMSEEELWCPDCFVNDLFYRQAESDAFQMKIRGARHTSFGDFGLYGWLIRSVSDDPAIAGERMIEIQNAYSLAFFDRYLKGLPSPLLDGPSADFPEVLFKANSNAISGTLVGPDRADLVIVANGTVIKGLGSAPIPEGIVVIDGEHIIFVGPASDFSIPPSAQIIDAAGGTILPGIIDAHVHSTSRPAIRREFLVDGVTSVCDVGSPLDQISRFAESTLNGDPVSRGFRTGPIVTAVGGLPDAYFHANLNYEVASPGEARSAVVELHNRGADAIKVMLHPEKNGSSYPILTAAELKAIVDEAHARGLPVRAHVSFVSYLGMAIEAGVDTVEHAAINGTEAERQSLSDAQYEALLASNDPLQAFFTELYPDYEGQLELMVAEKIIMVPTLERGIGDIYRAANPTREQEVGLELMNGIVQRFHELGGSVAYGSDYNIGALEPGNPVPEMEMLLAAGLTPMEVIEASTRHAALACGKADALGTLEKGKLADVIVVAGDPLQDIKAMNNVVLVIKGGEIAYIAEQVSESQHETIN